MAIENAILGIVMRGPFVGCGALIDVEIFLVYSAYFPAWMTC